MKTKLLSNRIFLTTIKVITIIFVTYSCSETITPPKEEVLKDPREMTWTADTLAYPESIQTLMSNILAFNSKDIFIYGHEFNAKRNLYHYDGNKWEVYDLNKYLYGYNVSKMVAFSRNNIWGVGDRGSLEGLIFTYNGTTWAEVNPFAPYTKKYPPLFSIDGENPTEFYTCGREGIVLNYKNGIWAIDTIKVYLPKNPNYRLHDLVVYKNEVFILGAVSTFPELYEMHYFIKGKLNNWSIIDSMDFTKNIPFQRLGWGSFIKGSNGKLYSKGYQGYYEWVGSSWNYFYNPKYAWGFYVFRDNYMLSLGRGGAEYYNGENWIDLGLTIFKKYGDVTFRAAWTDGKELFLVGNTFDSYPQKTIVLHGK